MSLLDPAAVRSASVTAMTDAVVGKISEPAFSAIANGRPVLWRHIAQVVSSRLRERNTLVPERNPRPVLFIGSSRESLPVASALQTQLAKRLAVRLWSDNVFLASRVSIESLESQIPLLDFAVLVLSPDDMVISRHSMKPAPRDNVTFELGLFMGGLGRHRTFLLMPRGVNLKVPTDLLGVTPIEYKDGSKITLAKRLAPACSELFRLITRTGTR
jgi:CRP/FNR family cyclic AMP-dependent transcriptional regulator